jgi:hypothetical protein
MEEFSLNSQNLKEFTPLSELARPGSPAYKRLRNQAKRTGTLVSLGDTEYVKQEALLNAESSANMARQLEKQTKKDESVNSGNPYSQINSILKIDAAANLITKALAPRQQKIESIMNQLDTEKDQAKRNALSAQLDRLMVAAENSQTKLGQLNERRKQLESEMESRIKAARKQKASA